jgi:hypothetical protein
VGAGGPRQLNHLVGVEASYFWSETTGVGEMQGKMISSSLFGQRK